MGEALVPGFALLVFVVWAAIVLAAITMPFAVFSIASSLRGIHRELRRQNGMPVPDGGGLFPNATVRAPRTESASLGHQLLK